MSIRIKLAQSPMEIDSILKVRHKVFVEKDGYVAPRGGYLVDHFDALPTTHNMIAVSEDEVVGGIRLVEDSELGTPADDMFDYRSHLPDGAKPVSCSMLGVRRAYRGNPRIIGGLLLMANYWVKARGGSHILAPVNPAVEGIMTRSGLHAVGEEFVDDHSGLPTLPMILDLEHMDDAFIDFISRQEIGEWLENFEREYFAAGEVIIRKGDVGKEAFVLVDGEAWVQLGEETSGPTIGVGEVFGELALLTHSRRTASVIAASDVEVMVLEKDVFEKQVARVPGTALSMLRTLSARLTDRSAMLHRATS